MEYYVFGSQDSLDTDILVLVESLGTTEENKKKTKEYEAILQAKFDKQVNVNLGIMGELTLTHVFKGSVDEVNNSIQRTYSLHAQVTPLKIKKSIPRDIQLKILRGTRGAVSFISRTQHRQVVKAALQGDLRARIDALDSIDFSVPLESSKYPVRDVLKQTAFQLGQVLCLLKGVEVYTKAELSVAIPELKSFLYREENVELSDFEKIKQQYVKVVRAYYPHITQWEEV